MMDFTENIDYNVTEQDGVSIGSTLKYENDAFTAELFVMGFETDGTPIVEYNNVNYHKDINWDETKYGECDKFYDGDVMPYVWDNFGELPNMGLIPPECDGILDEMFDEDI